MEIQTEGNPPNMFTGTRPSSHETRLPPIQTTNLAFRSI